MASIEYFVRDCLYSNQYCDLNQLYNYDNIIRNTQEFAIDMNNEIPEDINRMYMMIANPNLFPNWKTFSFQSYRNITKQFIEYQKLINNENNEQLETNYYSNIHLGEIYQGMGTFVKLMYNINDNYYYFIINGGPNAYENANNENLSNNIENQCTYVDYNYRLSFVDVINYIVDRTTDYYDDCSYLHSDFVITN